MDPASREAWALRVLLLHSRGCTCEASIRTIGGVEQATFMQAAIASGLLDDDFEYHKCLSSHLLSPHSLRSVFLIILLHCQPRDPMALLHCFFDELTEDFHGSRDQKIVLLFQIIANNVDVSLEQMGLERPSSPAIVLGGNSAFLETFVSHPIAGHTDAVLNLQQQNVHDAIIRDITRDAGTPATVFALVAPAGTGKTFLINTVLGTARLLGLRVVACATSGLAASLLGNARTGKCWSYVHIITVLTL